MIWARFVVLVVEQIKSQVLSSNHTKIRYIVPKVRLGCEIVTDNKLRTRNKNKHRDVAKVRREECLIDPRGELLHMTVSIFSNDDAHIIQVKGHFNHALQAQFRKAYETVRNDIHFIVDFHKTHTIDYSTIGMLLLLHDYSSKGQSSKKVQLINCNEEIRSIFDVLNFHHLFELSSSLS